MGKFVNLTGQIFGRLRVLKRVENTKRGNSKWLCGCDCGNEKIVVGTSLTRGFTKSCGCLYREIKNIINLKHGHNKNKKPSRTYISWQQMKQRCNDINHTAYKNYGGRGIKVCKRWQRENGFVNFLTDMGERPKGLSLDRIDNNLDYYKENCKWSTPKEQARNTRTNHLITYKGKTQCLSVWAREYNLNFDTLWTRLYKYGWSIKKALITPVRKYKKYKKEIKYEKKNDTIYNI